MATKKNTDAATETAEATVRVRITQTGTTACGFVFAAGAMVTLPASKAQTLEQMGRAVIVGV